MSNRRHAKLGKTPFGGGRKGIGPSGLLALLLSVRLSLDLLYFRWVIIQFMHIQVKDQLTKFPVRLPTTSVYVL